MNERRAAVAALCANVVSTKRRRIALVAFALPALLVAGCGTESRPIPEASVSAVTQAPVLKQRSDANAVSPQGGTSAFCEPVKTAYDRLFEVKNKDAQAQQQAARAAAQNFREAATATPAELREPLQGIADFYEQVAIGSNVGFRAIQDLLGNSNRLREAISRECGFAINAEPY